MYAITASEIPIQIGRSTTRPIAFRAARVSSGNPLVFASTGHQDLAGFEDLHLPAGACARVIAQLAGLHASGVAVAQAPDFLAGLRLPRQGCGPIGMRFEPVVITHRAILRSPVTCEDRRLALNAKGLVEWSPHLKVTPAETRQ
jgi:hypothetical protein